MSKYLPFLLLVIISLSIGFTFTACDDNRGVRERDFSAAPDPVNLSGIVPDTVLSNILIYNVEKGDTTFGAVTERDIATMKFTIWFNNGEGRIRDSSFEDGFTDAISVNIQSRTAGGFPISTGSYFPRIVAGMYEEGIRAVKVPPSVTGQSDTLRYDLELERIFD